MTGVKYMEIHNQKDKIMQLASNVEGMLRSYIGNFMKAEVITAARDVTGVKYMEIHNQKDKIMQLASNVEGMLRSYMGNNCCQRRDWCQVHGDS